MGRMPVEPVSSQDLGSNVIGKARGQPQLCSRIGTDIGHIQEGYCNRSAIWEARHELRGPAIFEVV